MNSELDNNGEKITPGKAGAAKSKMVSSEKLFGDQREIRIEHLGEIYSLRLTRNGKLILTK
jgi:hemin uptake protein HemP